MNNLVRKTGKLIVHTIIDHRKYATKYKFEGTIYNRKKLLFVLSGYKPYLWDDVFGRIKRFATDDMDVCIGSSGKYSDDLSKLCKENDWVYVSTQLNNVCVISNIIIRLFPKAEYIFKLDEDIYISKNYFDNMYNSYIQIEENIRGEIGYICPVLPLGFYGMYEFLLKNDCLDEYDARFGIYKIGGTKQNPSLRAHDGVDEFIWEKIGVFDKKVKEYQDCGFSYEICGTRSGIAAILFRRSLWDQMGGLQRPLFGIGVGDTGDEGQITSYCALNFKMMICVKNILVGHFAFGGAEQNVLKYRELHPEIFELHEDV